MPKSANQKLRILYLARMLTRETDEQHGLTMTEILDRLENDAGIMADRRAIYDDIKLLREFGYDVISEKSRTTRYFIGSREFEYPELTLLVDSVQSSKFLTEKKSNELIGKLESLASVHEARLLNRRIHVAGRIKSQNESIFYNVDRIHRALMENKQITFLYYDYDLEKRAVARKDGKRYTASPVGLAYVENNYYLITYNARYDSIVTYRVDRMKSLAVGIEDAERIPAEWNFDITEYCNTSFSMFDGEEMRISLLFDKDLMNAIIDRFGKEVFVEKVDDETGRAHVKITKSPLFFGWLAQYDRSILIDEPQSLAEEYTEYLQDIARGYTSTKWNWQIYGTIIPAWKKSRNRK